MTAEPLMPTGPKPAADPFLLALAEHVGADPTKTTEISAVTEGGSDDVVVTWTSVETVTRAEFDALLGSL